MLLLLKTLIHLKIEDYEKSNTWPIQRNAKKDGISVSNEQAAEILKFLEMLADIVVSSYLEEQNNKPSDKSDNTEQ